MSLLETEARPCPWCGKRPEAFRTFNSERGDSWQVWHRCKLVVHTEWHPTLEQAVADWNAEGLEGLDD